MKSGMIRLIGGLKVKEGWGFGLRRNMNLEARRYEGGFRT